MTLLYLFAGAMAGTVGIIARSVFRLEEEHPRAVHDHVCFLSNALSDMNSATRSASGGLVAGASTAGAVSWAQLDPSLGQSAVVFSRELIALQQSLNRENTPAVEPLPSGADQTEAQFAITIQA